VEIGKKEKSLTYTDLITNTNDNIIMQKIKFTSKTTLRITNKHGYSIKYKGYNVGELPNSFGFKYKFNGYDDDGYETFKEGKDKWFNYKGLTWVIDKDHWSKSL
tara:strand:- start:883 stop:1194 length:312 start_codon:yes stop_codon:yes gene_type:complete